jgi:saccharopine dehydrogenase-like NADP-dependent oxidoreductase
VKQVLVLGAGLVARPLVRYLLGQEGFHVSVASRTFEKAKRLIGDAANGKALQLDVSDEAALEQVIAAADLSVSLLPYAYHPLVARLCVKHRRHMVTTSYVKEPMQALDPEAKEAEVLLLNEIGVDPGIDHMSAMQAIERVRNAGGELVGFVSYCGGLPAPEANDNPFGYKFSWAPRGVILAAKNPGRYLKDGEVVDIPGERLLTHHWPVAIEGVGKLEALTNRDALPYTETYGIPNVKSMFRGTLRYPGWCETMGKIAELGFLDETERDDLGGLSFRELTARLIGNTGGDLKADLVKALRIDPTSEIIANLEWLGLLSADPLPARVNTLLDVLAERMLEKMKYAPGERDMIVMQHEFTVKYPDRMEKHTATLVDYGIPHGDSAMSRLVALPAAIAVRLILEGKIDLTGVHIPVLPQIYEPVLAELSGMGVAFTEATEVIAS